MRELFRTTLFVIAILLSSCSLLNTEFPIDLISEQMTAADDSMIPDSVKSLLKEDASRLALRDFNSNSANSQTNVIIPSGLVETYYNGLVHIYNANLIPARDSVFNIHKIQSFRRPEMHFLVAAVDSTKSWVQQWRNGQRLTGNAEIDSLMENYNLELLRYNALSLFHVVELISAAPLNISALGNKFELVEGIIFAEENGTVGGGNDIHASRETEHLSVEFSKGWGDCPAGCIHRHYWHFNVKYDGNVIFVGSFGDPI